jgi:monovalent cation:H+ antiporter, CPA1 family
MAMPIIALPAVFLTRREVGGMFKYPGAMRVVRVPRFICQSGLPLSGESVPSFSVVTFVLILLIASLVAIVSRRLKVSYSVGLVVAGVVIAFLPSGVELPLTRDLIFNIFLPPLVFEAAMQLRWKPFWRDLPVTLMLAFPGVLVAAAVVAAGMHFAIGWEWMGAALFGVLIAATDPVSVIATFKEIGVDRRLSGMVESESLLNDGAAAVGFALLMAVANGGSPSPLATSALLLWSVGGGVLAGVVVAGASLLIVGRTSDHLVDIALTTVAAYGSFLLAEHFQASGVLASLAAGLMVGNLGWKRAICEGGRVHVLAFWEYVAFLVNSFVFILIGENEAHTGNRLISWTALAAIVFVLLGRAIAVYPFCSAFTRSRLAVPLKYQHVLFWGGLRGALALALVLALPQDMPQRGEIVVTAFAVVAFSIFIQGITMPLLVRRLGLLDSTNR